MRQASGGVPRVRMTRLAAVLGVLAILLSGLIAPPSVASEPTAVSGPVKTADLSKFQPGNIISDAVFFDRNSMSEAQIQAFLVGKVPSCQSGYVCLKDWFDTSRTTVADAMCGAYSGGVRERASTIIFKVAQACGINPQVILATLQKEQSLVTHTWPSTSRYTIAMGQGCPDTAACDTRYYGFFNQVFGAAWQFKRYANPPGTSQYFTWYAPGKTWNVRYHPNVACGSTPVYIQNQATANLYYYTPYQPNAAALAAGYAAANNACSSYGNRNFYQYFTDWFGSGQVPELSSIDGSEFVTALSADGTVRGYPYGLGGRFGNPVVLTTLPAGTKQIVPVGDLDGDGRRDLISIDAAGVAWLQSSDGGKLYGTPRRLDVDWSTAGHVVAAGDFSGDGIPDVFTIAPSGRLFLWRGTTAGRFMAPVLVAKGWAGMSLVAGGVDLNRDGFPDVLTRNAASELMVFFGNGRGGFSSSMRIGTGWGKMTTVFSPGDFTGDGIPDVLARTTSGELWMYRGAGNGAIKPGVRVGTGWAGMVGVAGSGGLPNGVRVFPAGAGDLDGDLAPDVLGLTSGGALVLYRGSGSGGWLGSTVVNAQWGVGSRTLTMGDFSGDGIPDIGRITSAGVFELHAGNGDGTFRAPVQIGRGWAGLDLVTSGIDFDGDRRIDVIARSSNGDLLLYRGNGAGGFAADAQIIGTRWGAIDSLFYAGDFDGDKAPDLVARTTAGDLWIYPTNGAGQWRTATRIGTKWSALSLLLSPGDFDGTGGTDVLARSTTGALLLYSGNGRGGWSGSKQIGTGWRGMTWIG
ncbi:FG-GAP repeat domain-containing protein [Microbacterium sp.]|uniref:FG-GAP repeat domain-containing protein n=1 Tax=Microbacterium sp. TaxID=51671 RepID=UPI003F72F210